jgi:hypothetical protein
MKLRYILALLFALPVAGEAQSIHGRVVDAASGDAVPEATVQVTGAEQRQAVRTRTGADGAFTLPLRGPGTYRVRVERTGYAPATSQEVEMAAGEAVQVELRISAQPLTLPALTVVGRQRPRRISSLEPTGFYNREARGHGRFLKREDLERRPGNRLVNILDEVPGIRLYRDRRGNEYVTFDRAQSNGAFSRAQRNQADMCQPVFFLDGSRVNTGTPDRGGVTLNDLVPPEQIEGIEVYGSVAQIPVEFNASDAACGVVVIWTRKGS